MELELDDVEALTAFTWAIRQALRERGASALDNLRSLGKSRISLPNHPALRLFGVKLPAELNTILNTIKSTGRVDSALALQRFEMRDSIVFEHA